MLLPRSFPARRGRTHAGACLVAALVGLTAVPAPSQAPVLAEDRLRLPAGLPPAVAVVLGDIDGDGRADLIRAAAGEVAVLLQTPAGEFAPHPAQPVLRVPGNDVRGVTLARLRATGAAAPDLVVARTHVAPLVLLNDGSGVFVAATFLLPAPPLPVDSLLVGDLDAVPPDDIVVLPAVGRPQLLLGQGSVYRDASSLFAAGLLVQAPLGALADFDADGDADIVLASAAGGAPFVLENRSGFLRQVPLPFSGTPSAIATGDFDGDRRVDVALARAAPQPFGVDFVLSRAAGFVAYTPPVPFPLAAPAVALRAADLQGDGHADLVALQADGVGQIGLGDGQPSFQLTYPPPLLDPAPRGSIAAADLEGDGDVDLVVPGHAGVVGTVRDSVLLAHGRNASWVDTERIGFPIGLFAPEGVGAAVDFDADGELDLVAYAPVGRGTAWRNDGSARFWESGSVLPALAMRDVCRVQRATFDSVQRDLLVVASAGGGTAAPPGVRVLVAQNGRYSDASGRLPQAVQRGFQDAVPARVVLTASGTRAIDDLVLADAAGNLLVLVNQAGAFTEVSGAFAPPSTGAVVRALLTGDVDHDGRPDVVLVGDRNGIGGLEVYRRTTGNAAPLFTLVPPLPAATFGTVSSALLADFDGDGHLDVLAAQSGAATPLVLLAGDGRGGFTDATTSVLPGPLPGAVDLVAAVGAARRQPAALLLARRTGDGLALLRRRGGSYAGAEPQPVHGATRVTDLVVADFDTDGDDDCVLLTPGVQPTLLLGCDVHFAATAVFQGGREVVLRARAAEPGAIAAWLWSPAGPARLLLPGLGLLRLAPPVESLAVFPIGTSLVQDLAFPLPMLGGDLTLFFQLAVFEPSAAAVRLSNLVPATILAR